MAFSLNLITLASEADILIKMAQRDKRNIQHRANSFDMRAENTAENAEELTAELATAKAELASTNALIATLPDGTKKETEITKRMELEVRIRKLTLNGNKKNAVAAIEQEYDADLLDRQVAGIDAFITAVTERKAAL
jgi:hypothetical protein